MARPKVKLSNGEEKYDIKLMCQLIDEYIEQHKDGIPILKECCLLNEWTYDYVMQLQRDNLMLSQSIKKLLDWKEVRLEHGALTGQFDKTMAIFSLKQPAHGWTDKQVVAITDGIEDIKPIADMYKICESEKD